MGKYYYKDVSRTCSITTVKYRVTYGDGSSIRTTTLVLGHLRKSEIEMLPQFKDRVDAIIAIESVQWVKMKFSMPLENFIKQADNEVVEVYDLLI